MGSADGERRAPAVTISDVARIAGVSRTTVSDALNGRGRVQPATRRRVLDVATALGYRANPHARLLRGGRSGMLGIISSLVSDGSVDLLGIEYFVDILAATATTALSHGYAVVLLPPSTEGNDAVDPLLTDGALLLDPLSGDTIVERLESRGIPTASTGRVPGVSRQSGTWADNDLPREVRSVLDLLERRGARRIALLSNPPVRSYAVDTLTAYEAWMGERGLTPRVALTDRLASESTGYHAAQALFDADPPDAVYAPLDRLAVGAALAARSRGLTVPGDVLIAAGSDSEGTRTASPPITALQLNARLIGQRAVELLIDRVEGRTRDHEQVLLPATLQERASTLRPG